MRYFQVTPETIDGSEMYSLEKLRANSDNTFELGSGGFLFLRTIDNRLIFAVMEFNRSDSDGTNVYLSPVFYGDGYGDPLRECRHTYWGEGGYVFYPDGRIITEAFKYLSRYFDNMAEKDAGEGP